MKEKERTRKPYTLIVVQSVRKGGWGRERAGVASVKDNIITSVHKDTMRYKETENKEPMHAGCRPVGEGRGRGVRSV